MSQRHPTQSGGCNQPCRHGRRRSASADLAAFRLAPMGQTRTSCAVSRTSQAIYGSGAAGLSQDHSAASAQPTTQPTPRTDGRGRNSAAWMFAGSWGHGRGAKFATRAAQQPMPHRTRSTVSSLIVRRAIINSSTCPLRNFARPRASCPTGKQHSRIAMRPTSQKRDTFRRRYGMSDFGGR